MDELIKTLLSGGALGAILLFVQYLINRKDKKQEDDKKDEYNTLRKEFQEGLDEREKTSRARYDEHHIAIEKMNLQHQKDFQTLLEAIKKLESNDDKVTNSLDKIATKQDNMANGIMGLSHDKLIYCADKISERGAITLKEKSTLESIYYPYKALNGNGDVKVAFEHVVSLKVVSDEEAKRMDLAIKNNQRTII